MGSSTSVIDWGVSRIEGLTEKGVHDVKLFLALSELQSLLPSLMLEIDNRSLLRTVWISLMIMSEKVFDDLPFVIILD